VKNSFKAESTAQLEVGVRFEEINKSLETWKTLLKDCTVKLQQG